MGQDLIGYIVVGQKEISEEVISNAKSYLIALKGQMKTALKTGDVPQALKELVSMAFLGDLHNTAIEAVEDLNDRVEDSLVDDFLEIWEDGSRCSTGRHYGEDKWIMFTGDMSWGDSPDTRSFKIIENLELTDLYNILGLE